MNPYEQYYIGVLEGLEEDREMRRLDLSTVRNEIREIRSIVERGLWSFDESKEIRARFEHLRRNPEIEVHDQALLGFVVDTTDLDNVD